MYLYLTPRPRRFCYLYNFVAKSHHYELLYNNIVKNNTERHLLDLVYGNPEGRSCSLLSLVLEHSLLLHFQQT